MTTSAVRPIAETVRPALLLTVACMALGLWCPASRAQGDSAKATKILDIRKAAAEAELIVIGGSSFVPIHVLMHTGESGPVESYRLEVQQCLKGAYQHLGRNGMPFIQIPARIGDINTGTRPALPPPANGDTYIYFLRLLRAGFALYPRESPLTPDVWFIPATPENIEAVRKAIPLPTEWGRPSDGLQLGIRTMKPSYRLGEPIDIEICIRNVSDRSVTVPQHRLAANDCYPFTEFSGGTGIRVLSGGGTSSEGGRYVSLSKPVGRGQIATLPPVFLEPEGVYIERIRLDSWQWSTVDGLPPFVPGTRWMLHAFFDTIKIPVPFVGNPHLWRGVLDSGYFELRTE